MIRCFPLSGCSERFHHRHHRVSLREGSSVADLKRVALETLKTEMIGSEQQQHPGWEAFHVRLRKDGRELEESETLNQAGVWDNSQVEVVVAGRKGMRW